MDDYQAEELPYLLSNIFTSFFKVRLHRNFSHPPGHPTASQLPSPTKHAAAAGTTAKTNDAAAAAAEADDATNTTKTYDATTIQRAAAAAATAILAGAPTAAAISAAGIHLFLCSQREDSGVRHDYL